MIALGEPVHEVEEIRPQPGPQRAFLESQADIVIYGGAAGGGKSYALLLEPLRHRLNPNFGAVCFRRTYPQITAEGGLWDTAGLIYPSIRATMHAGTLEARFPSGARVSFRHLQHETNKFDWQGSQIPLIEFDELTHFTATQFWYLLSRNRSTCGVKPYVRATTNPEAGTWVLDLIRWWIDPMSGSALDDRSGVVRYFVRANETITWADSAAELRERYPTLEPKSLTFIPARLEDNPALLDADPGYKANLMALPRVERERLLGGNWLAKEDSIIEPEWLHRYALTDNGARMQAIVAGEVKSLGVAECRRFATIDTAGTSKEKAQEVKGRPPSFSVCGIWDYHSGTDALLLRHVWRDRVGWSGLKEGVRETLKRWRVRMTYIENAHFGPALRDELRGLSQVELMGPKIAGTRESRMEGAKLERATASGLLSRLEHGGFFIPDDETEGTRWLSDYRDELIAWSGLPEETSDQIDVSSYAAFVVKDASLRW